MTILSALILCFVFVKVNASCVTKITSTVCETLSDVDKLGYNKRLTNLIVGNGDKVPNEVLKSHAFKNVPMLEELTIRGSIAEMQQDVFMDLQELLILKLYNNSISDLFDFQFIVLPQLSKLDVQYNNIEMISSGGPFMFNKLRTVNLSHNKIRDLNWQTFASPGLQRLFISHNRIEEFGSEAVFSDSLLTLDFDNNQLSYIQEDAFKETVNLKELILSNNRFTTLWVKMNIPSLVTLDFSHNQIQIIRPGIFDSMMNLTNIYLNNNEIKNLPPNLFQLSAMNIEKLHVQSNRLLNLEFYFNVPFPSLREISFVQNPFPCNCLDATLAWMRNLNIQIPQCDQDYLSQGEFPICLSVDSEWKAGKCDISVPIEETMYRFLNTKRPYC